MFLFGRSHKNFWISMLSSCSSSTVVQRFLLPFCFGSLTIAFLMIFFIFFCQIVSVELSEVALDSVCDHMWFVKKVGVNVHGLLLLIFE